MRVSGTKQKQIPRKQRSPLSPRRPSHVSVTASLPPDLSSNAFDALRAARADDRLYVPLCLNRLGRVINTHGDILVSNASLQLTHTKLTSSKLLLQAARLSVSSHAQRRWPVVQRLLVN